MSWAKRTEDDIEPWYTDGLGPDRLRLGEIEAQIAGETFETDDPLYHFMRHVGARAMENPKMLRATLDSGLMIRPWRELLDDADLVAEAMAIELVDSDGLGPDRAALVEILNA